MKLILLLLLLGCFVASCSVQDTKPEFESEQVGDTLQNDYAEAFRIIRYSDYVKLQIILPESGEIDYTYYIGNHSSDKAIHPNELKRIVALSATHIGMMTEMNLLDKLVGISSEKYLCNPELIERVKNDDLSSLGDIGQGDLEAFIKIQPSLVIHSGFDPSVPAIQKLKSSGVPLFVNYDWRETHPLGRLEWLKVWGVLFGIEEEALNKYEEIRDEYLILKSKFENANKPTVLVGTVYGDVFNAPAGQSYMAQLIKDAGGDYVYATTQGTGSLTIEMEDLIVQNRNTSIWLNPAALNLNDLLKMNQRFELLKSVKLKEVYSYFHNVNCFWEESIAKPHLVLADLRSIFDGQESMEEMVYYLRLP